MAATLASPEDESLTHENTVTARIARKAGFFYLRTIRLLMRLINKSLPEFPLPSEAENLDPEKLRRAESALKALGAPNSDSQAYMDKHIPRLARTVALVPEPQSTGRALELGCYMQITPLLDRICGYREVRGAYYGQPGRIDHKTLDLPDGVFSCYVDHFDVERDRFPYPDGHFDLVIGGEIIEHLLSDPMWMLFECHRVLAEGGYLLLSTPNVGSITSVAKTLQGEDNPQIFSAYKPPAPDGSSDIGHMREYTTHELARIVVASGFEIERVFTTYLAEYAGHRYLLSRLAINGYSTDIRGEQTWCLARKRASLPVNRYPGFLYSR